jgi:hypothetical protein
VQQRAGRVRNPFGSGVAVVQDTMLEGEADRMGARAASAPALVQRKVSPVAPNRKPIQLMKLNKDAVVFVPTPQPRISRAVGFVANNPPAGSADAEYTWCRDALALTYAGQDLEIQVTNGRHDGLYENGSQGLGYYQYFDFDWRARATDVFQRVHIRTGVYRAA